MENTSIQETLSNVQKAFNTPSYVQGAPMVRENLAEAILRLPLKETPIRDRLPRKAGSGLAASWTVMTTLGVGNSPFAEGGTPTEDATGYVRRSAVYKELGKTKSVSDRMIAAGKTFIDMEAELTEVAMREVIQDEEQLIITGSTTVSSLQFDGLKKQLTTNVIDDNNNALGYRLSLLDQAVEKLVSTFNTRPTAIYCGFGMKRKINESLIGDVRVNLDVTNSVATGTEVNFYQSMIGKLPIIPTFAIAGDTTTYGGNTVEDIYIVTESTQGENVIYLEDLYGMGKVPLDRTGASVKFMVTECTVLVNRAEEFHVRVANVRTK